MLKKIDSKRKLTILKVVVLSVCLILIVALAVNLLTPKSSTPTVTKEETVTIHDLQFESLELADEEKERQRGLMFRKEMCQKCGMLFVFEKASNRSFWMENTFIALDIIFIDSNGQIVNIAKETTPLDASKRYNSSKPAKYVLEVNSGFSVENNLQPGDKLDISKLIENSKDYVETESF